MTDFQNLLSPLQIGALEVRNRVLVTAHVPGYAVDNKPGEQYINYHRQFAAGGVGLQITGGTPVHRSGLLSLSGDGLWNLDDGILPGYRRLAAAVHQEGGRILAQLAHSAGTVLIGQPGQESWSASAIRSQTTGNIPHEMTKDEIGEIVLAFALGAERVRAGELDGVEILAAFGYLPHAFLSPLTNHRSDDYGGDLDCRVRFTMELLAGVREKLGSDRILGIRLPGDEYESGGLDIEQMKIVCRQISESGLVDYLNITAHTNTTHLGRSRHWAPTPTPHGVFVHLAEAIREVVDVPVFAVGRIVDPRHAESIIAEGRADMVGMTRAHICDPDIVSKIRKNAFARIRPCVGANTCIANRYVGKTIRCMHNPYLDDPGRKGVPTSNKRRICVVGAGPAGLEAAMVSASRGHEVVLFEEKDTVGGQLTLWARSPSMLELGRIVDWRLGELEHLGVDVRLGVKFETGDLDGVQPDVVVIATGAWARSRNYPGLDNIEVTTPHELMENRTFNADRALVCSDGRGHAGLIAAEWLLHHGVEVELVTSDFALAADLDPTHRNAWYERLGTLGAIVTAQHEIVGGQDRNLLLRNVYHGRELTISGIDLLVDWDGCRVRDGLLRAGKVSANGAQWHAIGDCIAPRTVEVAIAEAERVAAMI